MKANKVIESLDSAGFKRGLDPKDSLKIGIRNKRSFKTIHECAQFFIDNISKLSEGRFNDANDLKGVFDEMLGLKGAINRSPLKMSKDYLEGFKERDAMRYTIDQKYPSIYIEEWGTTFDQLLEKLKGLRDFHIEIQKILGIYISQKPNWS
jgi:hypothetical protein